MSLDGPTADAFLTLCWGEHNQRQMAALLWSVWRNQARADRALARWLRTHRLPLRPDRLPTALPEHSPIPPASTPWPRERSPLPLVDLPAEAVLSLAEAVLWHQLTVGRFRLPTPLVQRLISLSDGQLDHRRAEALLQHWRHHDGPLACIRAAHPPATPPRIPDDDVPRFLAMVEEKQTVRAWGMLLRAGMAPAEARRRLLGFAVGDLHLPTGQPVDLWALHDRIPLPSGDTIPKDAAEAVVRLAHQSRRIDAIVALRGALPGRSLPALRAALSELLRLAGDRGEADPWAQTARRWLQTCIDELLLDRPMHWLTLSGMPIVEDQSLPTMAVGLNTAGAPVLFYSPSFVMGLDGEHCKGVLSHEIYHVLFGHLRPPAAAKDAPEAWTLACEVTVNEYVSYPLPGTPPRIRDFGLPPGESTMVRFQKLLRKGPRFLKPAARADGEAGGIGDDLLRKTLAERPAHHRDTADGLPGRDEERWLRIVRAVGDQLDDQTQAGLRRHAGSVAGQLLELIRREPISQLDWRALLRRMTGQLSRRQSTRRWPNRRAPSQVGIVPGHRRRAGAPAVLVAIDTSGSMTTRDLEQVAGEVAALLKRGLRVACVWCDTRIHRAMWLDTPAALERVPGRGGTDLRPPFGQAVLRRFRPDLLVYFTDGYGEAPERAPAGVRVLWILTGKSPRIPADYGERACLLPREERERVPRGE